MMAELLFLMTCRTAIIKYPRLWRKDIYKTFDKDFNLRGQIETELENHRKDSDSANDNTFEVGIEVINTLIKGDFSIHKSNVSTGEKCRALLLYSAGTMPMATRCIWRSPQIPKGEAYLLKCPGVRNLL